jgi:DNA-binding beta-propeller fold protein YncE
VAVHEQLNKVYVAFQGPLVISGTQRVKPHPFVAVIDGETDEVLYTIPGGPDGVVDPSPHTNFSGIGRGPWGVAVSGGGQFVYVGSFEDGLVSYINPVSDTVITNYFAGSDFQPTALH